MTEQVVVTLGGLEELEEIFVYLRDQLLHQKKEGGREGGIH